MTDIVERLLERPYRMLNFRRDTTEAAAEITALRARLTEAEARVADLEAWQAVHKEQLHAARAFLGASPMTSEQKREALIRNIEALLAMNKDGTASHRVPGAAVTLLEQAAAALTQSAEPVGWLETDPGSGEPIIHLRGGAVFEHITRYPHLHKSSQLQPLYAHPVTVTGADWKRAALAQTRKLHAVLHIPGVKEALRELRWSDGDPVTVTGPVEITDEMVAEATRAVMLKIQFRDFGHANEEGDWTITNAQMADLEVACSEAAKAALSAALARGTE